VALGVAEDTDAILVILAFLWDFPDAARVAAAPAESLIGYERGVRYCAKLTLNLDGGSGTC